MANVKISDLTSTSSVTGTEVIEIEQNAASKQTTLQALLSIDPDAFTPLAASTWNYNLTKKVSKTLTANTAITLNNTNSGKGAGMFLVTQDVTGSRTLSINGTNLAINSSANASTLITFVDAGNGYLIVSVNTGVILVGATGDTTPPTVTARATGSTTTILVTFSENVTGTLAGWSFKKNTVALTPSAVSGSGTSQFTFTVPTLVSTDVLLCSYNSATGDCRDLAGNPLASFTDQSVTNSIGSSTQLNAPTGLTATAISSNEIDLAWTDTNTTPNESGYKVYRNTANTFSSATLITTTAANAVSYHDTAAPAPSTLYYYWVVAAGNGTTTTDSVASASASATTSAGLVALAWPTVSATYTESPTGTFTSASGSYGLCDKKLALGATAVWIQMDYPGASSDTVVMGLDLQNTLENYATGGTTSNWNFQVYAYNGHYRYSLIGGNAVDTTVVPAAGDKVRLYKTVSAGNMTITAQRSSDGGTTWPDTIFAYTAQADADLFIKSAFATASKFLVNPKGMGVV